LWGERSFGQKTERGWGRAKRGGEKNDVLKFLSAKPWNAGKSSVEGKKEENKDAKKKKTQGGGLPGMGRDPWGKDTNYQKKRQAPQQKNNKSSPDV